MGLLAIPWTAALTAEDGHDGTEIGKGVAILRQKGGNGLIGVFHDVSFTFTTFYMALVIILCFRASRERKPSPSPKLSPPASLLALALLQELPFFQYSRDFFTARKHMHVSLVDGAHEQSQQRVQQDGGKDGGNGEQPRLANCAAEQQVNSQRTTNRAEGGDKRLEEDVPHPRKITGMAGNK